MNHQSINQFRPLQTNQTRRSEEAQRTGAEISLSRWSHDAAQRTAELLLLRRRATTPASFEEGQASTIAGYRGKAERSQVTEQQFFSLLRTIAQHTECRFGKPSERWPVIDQNEK